MDRSRQDVTIELSKSIWKERYTRNFRYFCPFCSAPRRLGMQPRPGSPMHFFQLGLTAAIFTLITWPLFGVKGLVSFVPFWIAFEIFYRAKVRASVRCSLCGFDPFLYHVNADRAKQVIREHWEEKRAKQEIRPGAAQRPADSALDDEDSATESIDITDDEATSEMTRSS